MPIDSTLSDFLSTDESDESSDSGDPAVDEASSDSEASSGEESATAAATVANDDGDEAHGDEAPEPTAVTYRWNPDGVECSRCGAVVERSWGDDEPVCSACVEW